MSYLNNIEFSQRIIFINEMIKQPLINEVENLKHQKVILALYTHASTRKAFTAIEVGESLGNLIKNGKTLIFSIFKRKLIDDANALKLNKQTIIRSVQKKLTGVTFASEKDVKSCEFNPKCSTSSAERTDPYLERLSVYRELINEHEAKSCAKSTCLVIQNLVFKELCWGSGIIDNQVITTPYNQWNENMEKYFKTLPGQKKIILMMNNLIHTEILPEDLMEMCRKYDISINDLMNAIIQKNNENPHSHLKSIIIIALQNNMSGCFIPQSPMNVLMMQVYTESSAPFSYKPTELKSVESKAVELTFTFPPAVRVKALSLLEKTIEVEANENGEIFRYLKFLGNDSFNHSQFTISSFFGHSMARLSGHPKNMGESMTQGIDGIIRSFQKLRENPANIICNHRDRVGDIGPDQFIQKLKNLYFLYQLKEAEFAPELAARDKQLREEQLLADDRSAERHDAARRHSRLSM